MSRVDADVVLLHLRDREAEDCLVLIWTQIGTFQLAVTKPSKIYFGNERAKRRRWRLRRRGRDRGRVDDDRLPPGISFASPMIMTVLDSMIPP